jgi:hypothetical protein
MVVLWLCIALEAPAGLTQKVGRHVQIVLQGRNVSMSKECGQLRQQPLYILACSVPRFDTMLCGAVAQVVKARLVRSIVFPNNTCVRAQTAELFLHGFVVPLTPK